MTGIRNAGTFSAIGSIGIELIRSGTKTDQGSYDFPDNYFTAGKITVFTIEPDGGIVEQYPDTYSFVVKPGGDMWIGSYI